MTSIDLETLFTTVYVIVDDWYQAKGRLLLSGKAGVKARFSDSEMLSLLLVHDFVPYPGETQFVAYLRANHLSLFPKLVDQSQYNRRGRNLRHWVEALRQSWVGLPGYLTWSQIKEMQQSGIMSAITLYSVLYYRILQRIWNFRLYPFKRNFCAYLIRFLQKPAMIAN